MPWASSTESSKAGLSSYEACGKGGVGEALIDYIHDDCVSTSRILFVTGRAPHRPFKGGQMLNTVLAFF
jgi:hypothetical protein